MSHMIIKPRIALMLAVLVAAGVQAKVSEEEAARLGKDLAPPGGEIAGNEDGTIPAWEPKWKGLPPGLQYDGPGEKRPNPYADEKTLVTISSENYLEYKHHFSEGQQALFETYPGFCMQVYTSHRDIDNQDRIKQKARWNATHTELSNGVESVSNYTGGPAFPIPQQTEEVLWNTRSNGCHTTYHLAYDGYGVFANGDRANRAVDVHTSAPFNNPDGPAACRPSMTTRVSMGRLTVSPIPWLANRRFTLRTTITISTIMESARWTIA